LELNPNYFAIHRYCAGLNPTQTKTIPVEQTYIDNTLISFHHCSSGSDIDDNGYHYVAPYFDNVVEGVSSEITIKQGVSSSNYVQICHIAMVVDSTGWLFNVDHRVLGAADQTNTYTLNAPLDEKTLLIGNLLPTGNGPYAYIGSIMAFEVPKMPYLVLKKNTWSLELHLQIVQFAEDFPIKVQRIFRTMNSEEVFPVIETLPDPVYNVVRAIGMGIARLNPYYTTSNASDANVMRRYASLNISADGLSIEIDTDLTAGGTRSIMAQAVEFPLMHYKVSGTFYKYNTITEENDPYGGEVRIYKSDDGSYMGKTNSNPVTGAWEFLVEQPTQYDVIFIPNELDPYNADIRIQVTAGSV
jgi:hypothetical protein